MDVVGLPRREYAAQGGEGIKSIQPYLQLTSPLGTEQDVYQLMVHSSPNVGIGKLTKMAQKIGLTVA